MTFGPWEESLHEEVDQLKRIGFAQRIKPENITVDPGKKTARVIGTEGIYKVTLKSCTCFDFDGRRLPCKHMYRLAQELEIFDAIPKTNRKAAKAFKETIPADVERYKQAYLEGAIPFEKFNKIVNALQSK